MRRTLIPATAACCITLFAAACATGEETTPTSQQAETAYAAKGESQADRPVFDESNRLGQLEVSVSQPHEEFMTSDNAGPRNAPAWAVEMRIVNNGPESVTGKHLAATGVLDGQQVGEVVDPANGFDGLQSMPAVVPGESRTVNVAFTGRGENHRVRVEHTVGDSAVWHDRA